MSMTVLIPVLALIVIGSAICVAAVEKETRRTHPELGDLPAALLTILLFGIFSVAVDRFRGLHAKMAEMNGASLGYSAPPTGDERR